MNDSQPLSYGVREFLPARPPLSAAPDVSGLFPDGVLTLCEHRDRWSAMLAPAEREQLGDVCEKRYAEFAAGRSQARRLISTITGTDEPLLIGDYRQPLWPAGIAGSISHCDHFCVVAVARSGNRVRDLGIDVDTCEELDSGVVDIVLTPLERQATAGLDSTLRKLIFSIKESNYKCCYHQVRAFIDFQQCEVNLDADARTFSAVIRCQDHSGKDCELHTHGKWLVQGDHLFTSAVLAE